MSWLEPPDPLVPCEFCGRELPASRMELVKAGDPKGSGPERVLCPLDADRFGRGELVWIGGELAWARPRRKVTAGGRR